MIVWIKGQRTESDILGSAFVGIKKTEGFSIISINR
jgi:hypothetical protein